MGSCWEDMEDRTGDKIKNTVLSQNSAESREYLASKLWIFCVGNLKLNGTGLLRVFI